MQPENAILGDINKELIESYSAIKEDWELVYRYLRVHHKKHCKEYYYHIRQSKPRSLFTKAARFIYLNRTCWNGLYRVNLNGGFNVPIGTKTDVIYQDDKFDDISQLLQNAALHNLDFEYLIDMANADDLVFVDPPYTVRHNHNGFVKYNENLFSWNDQERLYAALNRARRRGAIIIGTNAYHQCVRELYEGTFEAIATTRHSSISADKAYRNKFEELIIYTGN